MCFTGCSHVSSPFLRFPVRLRPSRLRRSPGHLPARGPRIAVQNRQRIRVILERAQRLGLIDADADLEVAVTLGTGSWYARALAGDDPPPGWPARAAALVWRAVGGASAPDPRPAGQRPPP